MPKSSTYKEGDATVTTVDPDAPDRSAAFWRGWNKSKRRTILVISGSAVGVLLVSGVGLGGGYYYFLDQYANRFYPGVRLEGTDLSGLTYQEAEEQLQARLTELEAQGVTVAYPGALLAEAESDAETTPPAVTLMPSLTALSASGNDREIFAVDLNTSLAQAYAVGRSGDRFTQAKHQFFAWRYGRDNQLTFTYDREYVAELLRESFSQYENPAIDADVVMNPDGTLAVASETLGDAFDYDQMVADVEQKVRTFNTEPLTVDLQTDFPEIAKADIEAQLPEIEAMLGRAPITLTFEDQSWTFEREAVGRWLSFRSGSLAVSGDLVSGDWAELLDTVNVPVQEARWKVETNDAGELTGLTELQPPADGRAVNLTATAEAITAYLTGADDNATIPLVVEVAKPKVTTENVAEMGIRDLLGTGHSNMGGSPYNRQLNIRRGVELLNGLLIPPGEEFSLLSALKPFTIENGYYPELVIKENKTIPEVGGGLCQIGTTTFRGAMSAGLDITQRRNHSYAVSYYSDDRNGLPGTDATIYDPAPDLRFINDTPGFILLQTRIDGTHLYFDFWGNDDGRVADFSAPTISGWVSPPPVKEIPTPDLAPGQRKCTESAHPGTSAAFTYTVDYADGRHHEEVFSSAYKPWQAVCLVGQEAAPAEPTPTPTTPATPAAEPEPAPAPDDDKKKS
jgi:vancomycin resistance protein YoaR